MNAPGVLWLGVGDISPDLERPSVWLLRDDDPEVAAMAEEARPTREDLADAALFSTPARGAGRLWRRRLLRATAARCLARAPQALNIVRSPIGAPSIVGPQRLCVSQSAQSGWTLIGLCEHGLGVDLEPDIPAPLPLDALHPAEALALGPLDEVARLHAFTRLWTVKESVLKALGRGLLEDPTGLETRFDGERAEVWRDGRLTARAETRHTDGLVAAAAVLA
jgi:4'-phosphopantetheinyl transferase